MIREYTCIVCPNGCEIRVERSGTEIISIEGSLCAKGNEYVTQEELNPQRNIASSVLLENGELPLASVRLTKPVPKERIFDVMNAIRKIHVDAPVKIGQVVIPNVCGLGADVIATKNVSHC